MLLLVTTGHPDMHRYASPHLGRLVQPRHYSSIEATAREGFPWAADNDAFGNFQAIPYVEMLNRLRGLPGCLFVTAPDVVGDAAATAVLFDVWQPRLRERHLPVALVAQDGQQEPPWGRFDALFIGGTDEFKLGDDGAHWVKAAKEEGKWVHVGRVNSLRRMDYCQSIGADSIDGSQWARFKKQHLRWGLEHLEHGRPLTRGRRMDRL